MYADLKTRAPAADTLQSAPAQTSMEHGVNEGAAVQAQSQLGHALNQRPAVVAQGKLAQSLSGRVTVQRYETVRAPGFTGKISDNGLYVTGIGLSEMYALPGHDVDRSEKTGETAEIRGADYDVWQPEFEVIQDCVAAMEEVMHGKKLKYGAPDLSMFRDSDESPRFFGESDERNRMLGTETDLGASADPDVREAFLIARQEHKRDEERPQFHGAAVVATDGSDYVTLESSAPLSGDISRTRVMPVYDMYGSNTRRRQTFKQKYQAEYGKDATVSVLEQSLKRPKGVTDRMDSTTVTDFVQSKFVAQREDIADDELAQMKATQRESMMEDELLQPVPVQRKTNSTGMPDALKAGIENLSGLSMDGVQVHYNSPNPAALQAHAYTQGTDIHVAPGQERYVPHEAWHVVQQAQGRVQPTMQLQGTAINDDPALENEADVMGARAAAFDPMRTAQLKSAPVAAGGFDGGPSSPVQAKIAYKSGPPQLDSREALRLYLTGIFGESTSGEMLSLYISDLEAEGGTYTGIADINRQINSRIGYDILGSEKWREFIDAKDQGAAIDSVRRGEINHPGEYYDYHHESGKTPVKRGEHYSAFKDADAFVSSRLNRKLTVPEYFHINALASQGISSSILKGVRTDDVTWGLPNPSDQQIEALKEKGLTDLRRNESDDGVKVHVPMPKEGIAGFVQQQLDKYYSILDLSNDSVTRFSAVVSLYEALEAVHPFKDGTSRTNHLVLNKLLVENGFDSAILNEPNSPSSSHEEFGRHVIEGMEQTRDIAGTDRGSSSRELAHERGRRASDIALEKRMPSHMRTEGVIPPSFVPHRDVFTAPFQGDLQHLMGGEREHIARLGISPISGASSLESESQLGVSSLIAESKDSTSNQALESKDSSDVSQTPLIAPDLEVAARRILGNARIDQYLDYKRKRATL